MNASQQFKIDAHSERLRSEMWRDTFRVPFIMHMVAYTVIIAWVVFIARPDYRSLLVRAVLNIRFSYVWQDDILWTAAVIPVMLYVFSFAMIAIYGIRGRQADGKTLRRGAELVPVAELRNRFKGQECMPLSDEIGWPKSLWPMHMLLPGATGAGKTTVIMRMLEYIRDIGGKAVIYAPKGGELIRSFYREETDLIYNPFDARSFYWMIEDDFERDDCMVTAFDATSSTTITQGGSSEGDHIHGYFVTAARRVMSAAMKYLYAEKCLCALALYEFLSANDSGRILLEAINRYDPQARYYVSPADSRVAQNTMSVLSQYTASLRYMRHLDGQKEFRMRTWLENDEPGAIFLPHIEAQAEALRGCHSMFSNALLNSMLSLPDDENRRIFIILDEFSDMYYLDSLITAFRTIRSKGGSFILGVQESAQLESRYGKLNAQTIMNQCNTWCTFTVNERDTAEFICGRFDREVEQMRTSAYAGEEDGSEGSNFQKEIKVENMLLNSELLQLPQFKFYLMAKGYPVALASTTKRDYPERAPAYIPQSEFTAKKEVAAQSDDDDEISIWDL